MIKSRHKTFGFWFMTLSAILFLILTASTISQWCYGFTNIRMSLKSEKEFIAQIIITIFGVLITAGILFFKARIIIDNDNKTILFKYFLGIKNEKYLFSDLEGYSSTTTSHFKSFTPYDTVVLIKNGRIIKKIDSFYYSNLSEMRDALKELKFLGDIKFNFFGNSKK